MHDKVVNLGLSRYRDAEFGRTARHPNVGLSNIITLRCEAKARCCRRRSLQYKCCHVMLDCATLGACCGTERGSLTVENVLHHVVSLAEVQMAKLGSLRIIKHAEQVTSCPPQCDAQLGARLLH
jgi:hypothetical protein